MPSSRASSGFILIGVSIIVRIATLQPRRFPENFPTGDIYRNALREFVPTCAETHAEQDAPTPSRQNWGSDFRAILGV